MSLESNSIFDDSFFKPLKKIDTHTNFKNSLVSLYYDLTRKDSEEDITDISNKFGELLKCLKKNIKFDKYNQMSYVFELMILYRLIAQTRDTECGKGERKLTYMLLYNWYQYYPILAIYAVKALVGVEFIDSEKNTFYNIYSSEYCHYGCWKDIKYLCGYVREHSLKGENDSFIDSCVLIIVDQLQKDYKKMSKYVDDTKYKKNARLSLVSKWVPRENSKYGWLFEKIMYEWTLREWPFILKSAKSHHQYSLALTKCTGMFRKILANMNRILDTIEIKQCSRNWSSIFPENINTCNFIRSKNALLNIKNGKIRIHKNSEISEDREKCSQNFKNFAYSDKLFENISIAKKNKYPNGNHDIYGCKTPMRTECSKIRNIPISYYVKKAFELLENDNIDELESSLLNRQWSQAIRYFNLMDNIIPIIDISLTFEDLSREPLYNAIALACLICEKSSLTKRIIFVSEGIPVWVNLIECEDFISMIKLLKPLSAGALINKGKTHCIESMKLILECVIKTNMTPDSVKKMTVVILQNKVVVSQHRKIKNMFMCYDVNTCYRPPFIIYWNLSEKNVENLPAELKNKHVAIISGYTPSLIDNLCFIGMEYVRNQRPYDFVYNILNNERYLLMEKLFTKILGDSKFLIEKI